MQISDLKNKLSKNVEPREDPGMDSEQTQELLNTYLEKIEELSSENRNLKSSQAFLPSNISNDPGGKSTPQLHILTPI
jgi:hypothetical protein